MTLSICDHAGAVGAALNAMAGHRRQPVRDPRARPQLSLVPLLCACGDPECRKPVLLQELDTIKRAHVPGVNTEQLILAQDAAILATRNCKDKPPALARRQLIPIEDLGADDDGYLVPELHERWKESRR